MASGSSQRWIGDFCFHHSLPLDPELREGLKRVARLHIWRAAVHGVMTVLLFIVGFFLALQAATEGTGWLVLLGGAMVVGSLIALMRTGASDIKRGVALRAVKTDVIDEFRRVKDVEGFGLDRYLDSLDEELDEHYQERETPPGWLGAATIGVSGGVILLVDGRLTLDGVRVAVQTVADVPPADPLAANRPLSDAEVEELRHHASSCATFGCLAFVVAVSILTFVFGWLWIARGWHSGWFIGGAFAAWGGWVSWQVDRRKQRLLFDDLREGKVFRWVVAPKKFQNSAPVEFLQRSGLIWSAGGWPARARRHGYQLEHLPSQDHRRRG